MSNVYGNIFFPTTHLANSYFVPCVTLYQVLIFFELLSRNTDGDVTDLFSSNVYIELFTKHNKIADYYSTYIEY